MEQSTPTNNKLKGGAMPHSLATLIEVEVQHEMHAARILYPQLGRISIEGQPDIGKVMVVGTKGGIDTNNFEAIFKSLNK